MDIKGIENALKRIDQARIDGDNDLLRDIKTTQRVVNQHGQILNSQHFKAVYAASYSHSVAYTNAIMLGGYAATFTLWNFLREEMSSLSSLVVGVLLLISVFTFSAFEVYKMISSARKHRDLIKLFDEKTELKHFPDAWENAQNYYSMEESRVWIVQIWITVISGFGAGLILLGILLYSLAKQL